MPRSLSSNAVTALATNYGLESVLIIAVEWVAGQPPLYYADRLVPPYVKSGILELSDLDDAINVGNNTQSSQDIGIKLNDTDGTLKALFDNNDIHQRNVIVYQWFTSLSLADKFELFRGKISSPIEWSEADRTLSFRVITQIEDTEFGFSPEEGQFPSIPDDLIGKPWPSVFGKYLQVPLVSLSESASGTLADGFGIHDFTIPYSETANAQIGTFCRTIAVTYFESAAILADEGAIQASNQAKAIGNQFVAQAQAYKLKELELQAALNDQLSTERHSLRILGGNRFPQFQQLTLSIGQALVQGYFVGETFIVNKYVHPEAQNYPYGLAFPDGSTKPSKTLPFAVGTHISSATGFQEGTLYTGEVGGDNAGYITVNAGARVTLFSAEAMSFVASITPGTVISVSAWQDREGVRNLVDVPGNLYSVSVQTYGSINATIVTLHDALSKRLGEGWDDSQLYVTFESSIGPNTADVLQYIIQTYTSFAVDAASFAAVHAKIVNYPSNFVVLDRPQVLALLHNIAFQARLGLVLKGDTFYLTYLPEQPSSVASVTESDVDVGTLVVGVTPTEQIVTKIRATWRASGAQEKDNTIVLRYNVKKYGTKQRDVNVFIYNSPDLVLKSMTYWLIRWGNTWKQLRFTTPWSFLKVETMDGLTLNFSHHFVANTSVVSRVEQASYNSASSTVSFSCWVPVRVGEMTEYQFAYPAAVSADQFFPTQKERAGGFAGGVGPGRNATGTFPSRSGSISVSSYDGGPDPFRYDQSRYGDEGGQKVSDVGDQHPGKPRSTSSTGGGGGNASATPTPTPVPGRLDKKDVTFIDLHKTEIVDTTTKLSAPLSSFFSAVTADSGEPALVVDADNAQFLSVKDGAQAEFDFKFDGDGGKFGAGTAFLQDDN